MCKNDHLPDQPDGDHLNPYNQQQRPEQQQGSTGNRTELKNAIDEQIEIHSGADQREDDAEKAEKVQRFFGVIGQKDHGNNIEHALDIFGQIFRLPELTG